MQENQQIDTYAVDVAFHEAGLNYGSHSDTVMRVIKKCLRTAMCLYGYMDTIHANIVFASPKINPAEINALIPCIKEAEQLLRQHGLDYSIRIIANEEFDTLVLQPILIASSEIFDTSELFLRSYQMYRMFAKNSPSTVKVQQKRIPNRNSESLQAKDVVSISDMGLQSAYQELKVGKLPNIVLRRLLEEGRATEDEIKFMQTELYSKQFFGLNYPLLVNADSRFEAIRYYKQPLTINGSSYYMCSQWFEVPANNDRPYLLRWIASHEDNTK